MNQARIITAAEGREAFEATRYHEYWGGLGDIVNHIYWLPCYQNLKWLESWERAFIVVSSHNPHAKELFLWHPKADQITICDIGFHCSFQDPNSRDPLSLRRDGCMHHWQFGPVEFHAPPSDDPALEVAAKLGQYVVFATGSAEKDKFVPENIVRDAAQRARASGMSIVTVGRNYIASHFGLTPPAKDWRAEFRLAPSTGAVDLIDKLSVPGVMKVIQGAAGIFTAHSACCMAAYHMKKPTFVLYNEFAKKTYLPKPGQPWQGYFHGAGNPGCDNAWYPEYTSERMDRWLRNVRRISNP